MHAHRALAGRDRTRCLAEAVLPGLIEPVRIAESLADFIRADIVVHLTPATLFGSDGSAGSSNVGTASTTGEVAELEGYGVIDARTARQLAAAAPTWARLWTDDEGVPLKLGRTAYRPPAGLKKFVAYRDGACRVTGCTRAAHRAEVDHTVEWQDGGTTDADNLALLCPKHHALKSLGLFHLRRDRGEGSEDGAELDCGLVWETLLGNTYPAEPYDRDHILGPRPVESPLGLPLGLRAGQRADTGPPDRPPF